MALQIKFSISNPESTSLLYRINKKEILENAILHKIPIHRIHGFVLNICENALKEDPIFAPKPTQTGFLQKYFPFIRKNVILEGEPDLAGKKKK